MPNLLVWYVDDLNPSITETITDTAGTAINLSGATVVFRMRAVGSDVLKVDTTATVVSAVDGEVQYDWSSADVDTAARYLCWWEVTTSSRVQAVSEAIIEFRAHAPIANTYVELEELKATLNIGSSYADADINVAIQSASSACDGYKTDRFYPSDETRYYTADPCERFLHIDSLNDLTAVSFDVDGDGVYETVLVENTDFYLYPRNAPLDGNPYTHIRLISNAGRTFPAYDNAVKVEGSFGWATTPAAVTQATRMLASRLLKRSRETP